MCGCTSSLTCVCVRARVCEREREQKRDSKGELSEVLRAEFGFFCYGVF